MKNMSKIKKGFNWLACAVIAVAMTFSCLALTSGLTEVKAEKATDYTVVEVADAQFSANGSSSVLKNSSSWDGNYVGDFKGNVISGIINLSADADSAEEFMDKTQLDRYEEFKDEKPTTPFGINTTDPKGNWYFPGTNKNVLMINTNDVDSKRGTAYAYSSEAIELSAFSFYKFSVWVKTGSFVQDRGAVVKLSGFDYDIGFWNIDNSDEIENGTLGFSEYVIYVATAQNTVSAVLNLQVGDSYTYGTIGEPDYIEHITPSSGYAFFDNITCYQLSANAYYEQTSAINSDKVIVHDYNNSPAILNSEILTSKLGEETFDMGSFANGLKGWTPINKEGENSASPLFRGIYDAGTSFSENNVIGLEADPYTPYGNSEYIDDRNILVMSAEDETNIGLESDDILIERNKFYRLSAWANTQNENNTNASIVIVGENNIPSFNYELSPVAINDVAGSGDINARYGWTRYYTYIRGSIAKDCVINLQLWLGYENNCSGTVLFDEIRLEELTYAFYNNNYSSGTTVSFDSEPSTSIGNGRFFNAENYGDKFPLKPVQWTSIGNATESDAAGVILTDNEHYTQNLNTYFNVTNPVSESTSVKFNSVQYPSMLLIASQDKGYLGFSSPAITLTNNAEYKISVTMRTINMEGSGANLWIDVNGKTIASVKNIQSTPDFQTYEFYLQGDTPLADGTGVDYTATLNIALGTNNSKASGSIYVAEAAMQTLASGDFDNKYAEFRNERGANIKYDMYSFSSFDFFGYDNTDTNTIKTSTNWSISDTAEQAEGSYEFGVFNPHKKDNNDNGTYIPAEITRAYDKLENKFDNVFVLQTRNTSATAQLINPLKLEANSYYMVSVEMAVIIHEDTSPAQSYGAGLYLNGENYSEVRFTDIKTTGNHLDKYEFRTYQFYVATGESFANLYLRASLGDASLPNRYVSGELYIAFVSLTNLGAIDESLVESEYLKIINNHVDSESTEEDQPVTDEPEQSGDSEKWWLIPSILFGVAILLAIVGVVIRTLLNKASRRQRRKQLNSYDRRYGYAFPESEDANENENEAFNDDVDAIEQPTEIIEQDIEKYNDDDESVETPIEEPQAKPEKAPKAKVEDNMSDFDE